MFQNMLRDEREEKASDPVNTPYHVVIIIFSFKEIILLIPTFTTAD